MAIQALFYARATPVSSQRHSDWCVDSSAKYRFAGGVNAVPLITVEMAAAAREYTIVFAGSAEALTPVILLGFENQENVYLAEDGGWSAKYIPAFVRRYPFVFSRNEDGNSFTLCIDESWAGCNQEGRGQRLFDDQNKPTPYIENVLGFLKEFQRQSERTQEYCNKLKALDLLDPGQLQFTMPGSAEKTLRGFMAVNRDKLKALSPQALSDLAQTDALELTYTHLLSMNNLSLMFERGAGRRGMPSPAVRSAPVTSSV
jgi:hypothetical protein